MLVRLGLCALALALVACGREDVAGPRGPLPDTEVPAGTPLVPGLALSAPIPDGTLSRSSSTVVYVSVVSGTFANAQQAVIRVPGTDLRLPVAIVEGGIDPVAVPASEGDSIRVALLGSAGGVTVLHGAARRPAPPRVVRTSPRTGRSDVPLNSIVQVVFSAPMDGATLNGSIQLSAAGAPVPGSVRLRVDGLAAEFVPSVPLAPVTDYELRVADAARDVIGQELEGEVRVAFRTAAGADTTSTDPFYAGPWDLFVYPSRHSEPSWHDPAGGRLWRPRALFPGDTIWLRASRYVGVRDSLVASWQSMTPGVMQLQVVPGGREAFAVAIAPGTAEVQARVKARVGSGATDAVGAMRMQVFEPMPASMLAGVRIDIVRHGSFAFRQEVDGAGAVQLTDASSLGSESVWWDEHYTGYGAYRGWREASVRPDGRLAAGHSGVSVTDAIGGALRTLVALPQVIETGCPVWSPDGRYLAVTAFDIEAGLLYIIDTETGAARERLFGDIINCPVWHPDGTQLIVTRPYGYWSPATGTSYLGQSISREGNDPPVAMLVDLVAGPFAADGRTLLASDVHGNLYRAGIDGEQRAFIAAVGRASPVAWSADGRLIAMPFYIMSADGRYARNVDGEILGFAP